MRPCAPGGGVVCESPPTKTASTAHVVPPRTITSFVPCDGNTFAAAGARGGPSRRWRVGPAPRNGGDFMRFARRRDRHWCRWRRWLSRPLAGRNGAPLTSGTMCVALLLLGKDGGCCILLKTHARNCWNTRKCHVATTNFQCAWIVVGSARTGAASGCTFVGHRWMPFAVL